MKDLRRLLLDCAWIIAPSIVFLSLMVTGVSASGICGRGIIPDTASKFPYMQRGRRCEGYINSFRSGSGKISIISFTYGDPEHQDSARNVVLSSGSHKKRLRVRASGRSHAMLYQMDTFLDPGHSYIWPKFEVWESEGLSFRTIGVFAFNIEKRRVVYHPVSLDEILKKDFIIAFMAHGRDLKILKISFNERTGALCGGKIRSFFVRKPPIRNGRSATFKFPNLNSGDYCLLIMDHRKEEHRLFITIP